MASDNYIPPGSGRRCEDLINKHKASKVEESTYQWAIRNAAQTRKLLSNPIELNKVVATLPAEETRPSALGRPTNAGRIGYNWAVKHGKSLTEASRVLGISIASIKSYRYSYKLPPLEDGRLNSNKRRRVRRTIEAINKLCKVAADDMLKTGKTDTEVSREHSIDRKTFKLFCKKHKIKC